MPAGRQALTAALCVVLAACAAGSQTRTTGASVWKDRGAGAGVVPRDALRLRGGGCTGCRGSTRQRKVAVVEWQAPRMKHGPVCPDPPCLTALPHGGLVCMRAWALRGQHASAGDSAATVAFSMQRLPVLWATPRPLSSKNEPLRLGRALPPCREAAPTARACALALTLHHRARR